MAKNDLSGKVQKYNVFDENGNLVANGTSRELSEKYDVEQDVIAMCARGDRKLKKIYTVTKDIAEERPRTTERMATIKKLYEQGVGAPQISKQMHIALGTAEKYIHEMKKRGDIT